MAAGKPGSGPRGFGRRQALKQVLFRVDRAKVDEFYRMLSEERIKAQEFLTMCVERYMTSDPRMRALVEAWRRDQVVSEKERDAGGIFSGREADDIMREIEGGSD